MKDSYNRTIEYMRISITDRCNLRCRYCMPKEAIPVGEKSLLTFEEICTIAEQGARLGIRWIKVTGGEPLMRKGCISLISMLKQIHGIEKVTLTTNGILLNEHLDGLVEAGIDGINVSLDTLDQDKYRKLTGGGDVEMVMKAILHGIRLPVPIKINAVSLDEDWQPLIRLAREYPMDVRFIELMPVGYGKYVSGLSHERLLKDMKCRYPGMRRDKAYRGMGPAVYYQIPGFQGRIGMISAIHGKFCSTCNRVRLTSQGYFKPCLCYDMGMDLRRILRETTGESEKKDRVYKAIEQGIKEKPGAHCFDRPEKITEQRHMAAIGG
ncbi:GTP 3',8-cyclase MoaA [Lachnospiraceae bacterium 62-35]